MTNREWIAQSRMSEDQKWKRHGTITFDTSRQCRVGVRLLRREPSVADARAITSMIESGHTRWFAYENDEQFQFFSVGEDCALDKAYSEVKVQKEVYYIVGKVDLETGVIFSLTTERDVPRTNVHSS